MGNLGELISKSYEVLSQGDVLWHLVKVEHPTTSFIHFTTTGVVAFKLAQMVKEISRSSSRLEEIILQLEQEAGIPFEDYCFLVGLLHDYEKLKSSPKVRDVDEFANYVLKFFNIPEQVWELIKQDAKSVEAGVSQLGGRHHELVVTICHVADVLSSQDTVFGLSLLTTSNQFTVQKIKQLELLGLRLGSLYIGSHRLFTILRSKDVLELFGKKGWIPLLLYKDGVVFAGTKASNKVSLSEVSELLASEIFSEIYDISYVENSIDQAAKTMKGFVGLVAEALAKELPKDRDAERQHLVVLANLLARAVRGELSVVEAVELALKETGKNLQSFQKSILPPARRPLENMVKDLPPEIIASLIKEYISRAESDEVMNIARLSYFVAGWTKRKEDLAKLYRAVFGEEPPRKDILTVALATIVKTFQYVRSGRREELAKLYEQGLRSFLSGREGKWKYEVSYYVSSYISGDIVEPLKASFPETDKRCVLCRSPVFSEEPLPMDEYGKAVAGSGRVKGVQQAWTNDDVPLADKDEYTASTEEPAKYTRPICTLCKYEGTIIGRALVQGAKGITVPFIAIYFRPAIAPEILSFAVKNIVEGVKRPLDLAEIYGGGEGTKGVRGRGVKVQLPLQVVPNYLGAFIVFSYKEGISERDSGEILREPDLSGRRDQVYYGLLLIPALAREAGGGQFKICLSIVDLAVPPAKLVEAPVAVRFLEKLNSIVAYLREKSSNREFLELYSASYYYVMRFLEGVAIKLALWYDHSRVSEEKSTATWIVRGVREVDELPLHIALLTPPPTGFDIAESKGLRKLLGRSEDRVYKRELYRSRFSDVCEIASELSAFLSRVEALTGVGTYA